MMLKQSQPKHLLHRECFQRKGMVEILFFCHNMTNAVKRNPCVNSAVKSIFLCSVLWALTVPLCFADVPQQAPKAKTVQLQSDKAPKIHLSPAIGTLKEPLEAHINTTYQLTNEDTYNLKQLWQAVINHNPVVQYGLKILATPPELRYFHTSILSRAIGGLLSGVALVPYMMGANQYEAGAASISANMMDRAINHTEKEDPSKLPSDIELVELSSFVQGLQKSVIENYFQYKHSLMAYVKTDAMVKQITQQYPKTTETAHTLNDLWVQSLYQSATNERLLAKQSAQKHYLALERLVGTNGMKDLVFNDMPLTANTGKDQNLSNNFSVKKDVLKQ